MGLYEFSWIPACCQGRRFLFLGPKEDDWGFPKFFSGKSKSRKTQGKILICHWTPDLADKNVKSYRGWDVGGCEKDCWHRAGEVREKCLCKEGCSKRKWKCHRESRVRARILQALSQDSAGEWLPHSPTPQAKAGEWTWLFASAARVGSATVFSTC